MNTTKLKISLLASAFLFFGMHLSAQVGIGTTSPQGALDIESNTFGMVYPKVALTNTSLPAPVINPTGGALAIGTVVYNTATTQSGTNNDVSPGLYVWNGSAWMPQFPMEDYKKYEQTGGCERVPFDSREEIAGLEWGTNVFVPKYSGTYKIKVTTSFGAGEFKDISSSTGNNVSTGTAEGNFLFTCIRQEGNNTEIDGTAMGSNGAVYCHSYSAYNENNSPAKAYNSVNLDASRVYTRNFIAGNHYDFKLEILLDRLDTSSKRNFVGNGTSGEGLHHVGHDIPCTVEFTFLGQ